MAGKAKDKKFVVSPIKPSGWAVKYKSKTLAEFNKKDKAIKAAEKEAKKRKPCVLIIKKKDGKQLKKITFDK